MRGWRNRQTRWIQVPVPERAWGFNSPLAHRQRETDETGSHQRRKSWWGPFLVDRTACGPPGYRRRGLLAQFGARTVANLTERAHHFGGPEAMRLELIRTPRDQAQSASANRAPRKAAPSPAATLAVTLTAAYNFAPTSTSRNVS